MPLVLHLAKGTVATAPHILLEEIGVPFDLIWVDFANGEQRGETFGKLNPKGRVPVLITPQGPLTETGAILNYLSALHPEAGLTPADPVQRARLDELAFYLAATLHISHAHKMRGHRWSDDPESWPAMTAKVTQNMTDGFAVIEAGFGDGPWVLGADYSTADIYLFAVTRWLEGDGVALAQFPKVAAHFAAMSARPAVQRAMALHI